MKYWNSGKEKVDIARFDMDIAHYDMNILFIQKIVLFEKLYFH